MNNKVVIYKDKGNRFRWRRVARNGKIVADSSQSYRSFYGARKAAHRENDDVSTFLEIK